MKKVYTPEWVLVTTKVAGVTFKNGRRNRQTILRQIYWHDEPYQRIDKDACVELVASEYEGQPAVEVWVMSKKAKEQIGYIPKESAAFFAENLHRLTECYDFDVSGGGQTEDGERIPFGATFTARFAATEEEKQAYLQSDEYKRSQEETKRLEERTRRALEPVRVEPAKKEFTEPIPKKKSPDTKLLWILFSLLAIIIVFAALKHP